MLTVRRQVADPSLGVGDMMKVLRAEMASKASWDLWKYLLHPQSNATFNWKTSPHPGYMAQTADLMYRFCSIAPNGILQGSKLRQAILKLGHERKINWSKYNEDEFSDRCDFKIRVLLSHFRCVKQKAEEYTRCMKKASEAEQLAIDKVLALMCLDSKDGGEDMVAPPKQTSGEDCLGDGPPVAAASSSTALVPFEPGKKRDGSAAKGIFQKILTKQDSNTSTEQHMEEPLPLVASLEAKAVQQPSLEINKKRLSRQPGFCVLPEEPMALPASPMLVKKEKKKEQETVAPEAAAKKVVKHGAKILSDDDVDIINEALQSNNLSTGSSAAPGAAKEKEKKDSKKKMKKPAAASKQNSPKKKAQPKKQNAASKKPAGPPGVIPDDGEGSADCVQKKKSSFRRRKTSSAYHKEMARCESLNMSPTACKKMARAAYSNVAQQIDSGVLKEEPEDVD